MAREKQTTTVPVENSRDVLSFWSRYRTGLVLILALAYAFFLAEPHFSHWLWQDEIYTLVTFATGDPTNALLDYHLPNNHILFSLILGQIKNLLGIATLDIMLLRSLMFFFFSLSLVLTFFAVRKLFSFATATLSVFMLATSHVILSFCTEIRGYCFSWIFTALGLYAVAGILDKSKDKKTRWWWLYGISAFCSVGVLPSNLAVFAALGLWWILFTAKSDGGSSLKRSASIRAILLLWLLPFTGLLFLVPVYSDLAQSVQKGASVSWMKLAQVWPWAALRDFWWLAIMLPVGLLFRQIRRQAAFYSFLVVTTIVLPLILVLPIYHHTPSSRVFSTYMPLVIIAIAAGVSCFFALPLFKEGKRLWTALVIILLALCTTGWFREKNSAGYFERNSYDAKIHNIYDQMHQYNFDIIEAVRGLREIALKKPSLIVIGDCYPVSVFWYCSQIFPGGSIGTAPMVWDQKLREESDTRARYRQLAETDRILVMVQNKEVAEYSASPLGEVDTQKIRLLAQYGYFKIYEVHLRARQGLAEAPINHNHK